ncbi:Foldase protein PrsA precursor [Rubripirellula lacrimiformis]|uniref:peptidylprolyl isomerase n=1 Tax=Rubripirellula lacrimiformis TaxID=1930273 RepID=A0A517NGX6_9BACT|nr:peptidylprolyl isomerase [Rubripirellula lacrimiformis]QDT06390.1 Foldase protein PrsA precursor [Rubripirellula lacrimiformis]
MPVTPARQRPLMTQMLRLPCACALSAAIAVGSLAIAMPAKAVADSPSNVVAVVNADPITRNTLSAQSVQRYGTEVIDNMINRHLIMQACQHNGIEVTKAEVTDEIRRLASKFGLSMDAYLKLLQEERNIDPNQYSREIIWPMLALRRLVAEKVEVTQEEFNHAFVAQFGEAAKCRLIMSDDEAKIRQLQARAKADPSQFSSLAKQFSEDEASASVGGLIPPIRRYSGDSRLEEAAFSLKDGDVSEVLELGDQWIFLQAVRRIPAMTPSPQALPAIREQISDRIRDEKMRSAASELFAKLQQEANVIKVLGNPELEQQYPGAGAIINGEQITLSLIGEECIKRHGEEVLDGEINRKLLTQALRKAGKQVTDADLQNEIDRAAISYGIVRGDGTPDAESWMNQVLEGGNVTRSVYMADSVWPSVALTKLVEDEMQLSESDLQEGFESAYGPRVEILACVLSDQRSAQKIWEMARDNPTEDFFGRLAEQYSVEPVSSSNMGKVPPIRKYGGQPAVEKEAFSLKPGQLSGIVATGGKYIIMRCQGFTEPVVTDRSAVQSELVRDLTEKKMRRLMAKKIESLRTTAEIDNFLAATANVPRESKTR